MSTVSRSVSCAGQRHAELPTNLTPACVELVYHGAGKPNITQPEEYDSPTEIRSPPDASTS